MLIITTQLSGKAAKEHIYSLKLELHNLSMYGYEHSGSLAHGARVSALKANVLSAMEELRYFGVITVPA